MISYKFKFNIIDNRLTVADQLNKKYIIQNIDDYSLEPLLKYLTIITYEPDLIELNEFLKIDKFMDSLYIRKIWDAWEDFLLQLFSSNVVKTLFDKMFKKKDIEDNVKTYNFINKNEIKLIINKVKYFIFKSDFYGMTIGKTLSIYLNGNPFYIKNDILLSKLDFLSCNVKSNLNEIIGHLNVRVQYYLTKDKRYLSPKPQNPSRKDKERDGKESGEFIEELLFGTLKEDIELEQMLYILDIKNYEKDLDKFKEDYIEYGNKKGYSISQEFKSFLSKLDINSDNINFNSKNSNCSFHMHKGSNKTKNYHRFPMLGYDDIYSVSNFTNED